MGDTAVTTAIATVIATIITGGFAYVTQRSASKAAARNLDVSSRTDIEKEAFDRAKTYYTDTIDRLERDQADDRAEIASLKVQVREQGEEIDTLRAADRVKDEVIADLRRDLNVARTALQLRFPDE